MQIIVNILAEGAEYASNLGSSVGLGMEQLMIALGILLFVPNFLIHYFDFRKSYWKISEDAQNLLKENLLAKFLNYDEKDRSKFTSTQIIYVMIRP